MLIDEFVPVYDFYERHQIAVPAPGQSVREAVQAWQPADSLLWRALLVFRGLGRPDGSLRQWAEGQGFLCLGETQDEVVYGQIGRFWLLNERAAMRSPRTVEEFRAFNDPTCAIAVMNLWTEDLAAGRTLLSTETRVRPLGAGARRRFRLYWLVIRPFSGLLRRSMLHGIKAKALAAARAAEA